MERTRESGGWEARVSMWRLSRRCARLLFVFFQFVTAVSELEKPFQSPAMAPRDLAEYKNRSIREICGSEEYYEAGRCCAMCPAGTRVIKHCRIAHERGLCANCITGETFMEHASGLERCLSCKVCREDQEVVRPCIPTNDTVCQCKPKTFCPPDKPCEFCYACTERCPIGKKIAHNCNATNDIICESQTPLEPQAPISTALILSLVIPIVIVVVVVVVIVVLRRENTKQPLADTVSLQDRTMPWAFKSSLAAPLLSKNPVQPSELGSPVPGSLAVDQKLEDLESSEETNSNMPPSDDLSGITMASRQYNDKQVVNEDSNMICAAYQAPAKPSDKPKASLIGCDRTSSIQIYQDDSRCFYSFIKTVPVNQWRQFMRTMHLTENEIDVAIYDNPGNIYEQHYQMLCKWKHKSGKEADVKKLLEGLKEMNLGGCAENVYNALIDQGIFSVDMYPLGKY